MLKFIIMTVVYPPILSFPWYHNIPILRKIIISYSRPWFGFNQLQAYSFYLVILTGYENLNTCFPATV